MDKKSTQKPFVERALNLPRLRRLPMEIRVEVESTSKWLTSRTRDLNSKGLSLECDKPIAAGDPMNVLLYIPRGKEIDLIKVHSEAVWCTERSGLYQVGSVFRKFAPGDERRLREWLKDLYA